MKTHKLFLRTILLSFFILISCQEDKIIETGTVTSQDYIFAENLFNDVGRIVEDAFYDNGESKTCPSYTLMNADTSDMDTIVVDFGDGIPDDCLSYGKERNCDERFKKCSHGQQSMLNLSIKCIRHNDGEIS